MEKLYADNDHYYALFELLQGLNLCTNKFYNEFMFEYVWGEDTW